MKNFFLSQHICDLKNLSIFESYKGAIEHLRTILEVSPEFVACDMHPEFYSTQYAYEQNKLPIIPVQHHHAHMASCMFENKINEPVIGVIFDGMGYGTDGNSWGGEFFIGDYFKAKRMAHFQYFPLLGGDKAVKEPYKIALALLFEVYKGDVKNLPLAIVRNRKTQELDLLQKMYERKINAPLTSSVGRIFDAVSALMGIRENVEYEAQAAIEMEQIIDESLPEKVLPYELYKNGSETIINILPAIKSIAESLIKNNKKTGALSKSFHDTMSEISVNICKQIKRDSGLNTVVLTGGVFQNQYLLKHCFNLLTKEGFNVFIHSSVPANDGGIALGQAIIACHQFIKRT